MKSVHELSHNWFTVCEWGDSEYDFGNTWDGLLLEISEAGTSGQIDNIRLTIKKFQEFNTAAMRVS